MYFLSLTTLWPPVFIKFVRMSNHQIWVAVSEQLGYLDPSVFPNTFVATGFCINTTNKFEFQIKEEFFHSFKIIFRQYAAIEVHPSEKPLTEPRSPKFSKLSRERKVTENESTANTTFDLWWVYLLFMTYTARKWRNIRYLITLLSINDPSL